MRGAFPLRLSTSGQFGPNPARAAFPLGEPTGHFAREAGKCQSGSYTSRREYMTRPVPAVPAVVVAPHIKNI